MSGGVEGPPPEDGSPRPSRPTDDPDAPSEETSVTDPAHRLALAAMVLAPLLVAALVYLVLRALNA